MGEGNRAMRSKKQSVFISPAPCYKNSGVLPTLQVTEKQFVGTEDRRINCPKVSRNFSRRSFVQKREVRDSQAEK